MKYPKLRLTRRLLGQRLRKQTSLKKFLRWIDLRIVWKAPYRDLLRDSSPDAVFIVQPYKAEAYPLIREAARQRIPVIAHIPSWDNVTMWETPTKVDQLIVSNDRMRDQAIGFFGYDPQEVRIAGIPRFDVYANKSSLDRESFIKMIGGDPKKKIITYATGYKPTWDGDEVETIEIIDEAMKKGEIKEKCQIIVRLHPKKSADTFERIIGRPGIILQSGEGQFDPPGLSFSELLKNTLVHSDVLINLASTLTLEACIVNTPVINIGFQGSREESKSVRAHFDQTDYKNLLNEGGLRVAWDPDNLINHINAYLSNPLLDSDGRKRIVEKFCYKVDGKSLERLLTFLVEFLK